MNNNGAPEVLLFTLRKSNSRIFQGSPRFRSHLQSGFSLLEVLVALVVLSIGLLGFAQAEIIALHHIQTAYWQSIAQLQMNALTERLRACHVLTDASCMSREITAWKTENGALLPAAHSEVTVSGSQYVLTLHWQTLPLSSNDYFSHATLTTELSL